jgi:hypothetical protein
LTREEIETIEDRAALATLRRTHPTINAARARRRIDRARADAVRESMRQLVEQLRPRPVPDFSRYLTQHPGPAPSAQGWDADRPLIDAAAEALVALEDEGRERPTLGDIAGRLNYHGEPRVAGISLSKALHRAGKLRRVDIEERARQIRAARP